MPTFNKESFLYNEHKSEAPAVSCRATFTDRIASCVVACRVVAHNCFVQTPSVEQRSLTATACPSWTHAERTNLLLALHAWHRRSTSCYRVLSSCRAVKMGLFTAQQGNSINGLRLRITTLSAAHLQTLLSSRITSKGSKAVRLLAVVVDFHLWTAGPLFAEHHRQQDVLHLLSRSQTFSLFC